MKLPKLTRKRLLGALAFVGSAATVIVNPAAAALVGPQIVKAAQLVLITIGAFTPALAGDSNTPPTA
jgi:hypothetical protein